MEHLPQRRRFGNGMLHLSRKIGEKIVVGDDIVITVVDINKRTGEVRIGIEAPKNIPVFRTELLEGERK